MRPLIPLLALALLVSGCVDSTEPRPPARPAAPRGLHSTTGDRAVLLEWLPNTERDVAGYRVYAAACASGPECPYTLVGSTVGTSYQVRGLNNGVTRYFAVAAFNTAGYESELSLEDIFDTPRPEGQMQLFSVQTDSLRSGWDFSTYTRVSSRSPNVDIVFSDDGTVALAYAPYPTDTDIQDAGYASSLDAVDFAPSAGWSPTHAVELIVGHCYVVWTHGDRYGKFRVTTLAGGQMTADWAFQTDPGNPELRVRRPASEDRGPMRTDLPIAKL